MRYIIISLFLFPLFMSAQNVGIGTTNPTEKLEVNGIIFSNQGGIKFPDGTIQTTAAPPTLTTGTTSTERGANSGSNSGNTALVIEFSSITGLIGPASGPGFSHGINIDAVYSNVESASEIDGGIIVNGPPSFSDVSFRKNRDHLSAKIPFLVAKDDLIIPYIAVFHLRYSGGSTIVERITRYEDCVLFGFEIESYGEVFQYLSTETVSFAFTRACYRTFEFDDNDIMIGQDDSCWDKIAMSGNELECSCSF